MENINHPVSNNNSLSEIHESKDESVLYSILANSYYKKIDKGSFHYQDGYKKFK